MRREPNYTVDFGTQTLKTKIMKDDEINKAQEGACLIMIGLLWLGFWIGVIIAYLLLK